NDDLKVKRMEYAPSRYKNGGALGGKHRRLYRRLQSNREERRKETFMKASGLREEEETVGLLQTHNREGACVRSQFI
ncbi:MAG: hypothetical protein ACI80I_001981, partial [Akkermansiaceae bacterium]